MDRQAAIKTDALTRLDHMPWTAFHTAVIAALGVGWALDSFETNIIGSVFGVLKSQWHLSASQGSVAVSVWVGGMLIGAIGFGYLADRFGRKRLCLATLLWYAAFSTATVLAWSWESFLCFRLMAALAVGGEYSAVTAAMGEFIPRKNRGRTDSLILSGFPIGALLSAIVSYFLLNHLPPAIAWRVGFGLGALMAVVFVWIRKVVPESPRWLLQHGRLAEAEAIVDKIAATAKGALSTQGQKRYEPTSFAPSEPAFFRNIAQLCSKYRAETLLASATNFSQAVVVYGTLSLMALIILPFMKVPAASMPLYYALGNGAALLGGLFAAFLVEAWGRRASLFTSYTFTVCAIVGLYLAQQLPHMVLGYCLIQFGVTWAYITAYVVSAEILPTRVRASGLGISVAVGRLGAMVTPVLLTNAFMVTGNPSGALLVLLVLAAPGPVAALLWWLRGRETRGVSLEQGSVDPLVGQLFRPQPAVVAAE